MKRTFYRRRKDPIVSTENMENRAPRAGFRIFKIMMDDKDNKILINTVRNLNEAYKFIKEYDVWSYKNRIKYHKIMIEWNDPVDKGLKHFIDFSIEKHNDCRCIEPETAKIYDSNDPIFREQTW